MALFVDDGDRSGGVAVLLGVALRAVGGVCSPCGVGSGGVFWRSYGRVLKSAAMVRQVGLKFACCLLPAACCLLRSYDFC